MLKMIDIRWLDIPAGDREVSKHPSAFFIDMQQYSRFRALQVMFEDGVWCDVPIVEFMRSNAKSEGPRGFSRGPSSTGGLAGTTTEAAK